MSRAEPARQRAREQAAALLRAARGMAPPRARSLGRRLAGRGYVRAARVAAQPELSVVVPVYNVEDYLRECLDSLLAQSLANLEVVCVDDGSTDSSLPILQEYADADPRVVVLTQPNSGQGMARNVGVAAARGEFLTFVDSDDTVPEGAFEHMVTTLRESGSDFTVGSARRMSNGRYFPTRWTRVVHRVDRFGTTIDEFPVAMQDIIACNRLFRTAFWVEKVGGFRGHIAYEDHVPMLAAYVRAGRFDVLARTTYNWRVREDQSSTGQQKASLENLLDRIAVKEEADLLLTSEASELVYDTWVARTLDVDFPAFVPAALGANDLYQNLLSATYRTFLGRASGTALSAVRHYQKLLAWLAAEGDWSTLERVQEHFRRIGGRLPPTEVVDGHVLAATGPEAGVLDGAPAWVRELAHFETSHEAAVQTSRWLDDTRLELAGWAMVRGVDSTEDSTVEAWLGEVSTAGKVPLQVSRWTTPAATLWANNVNTVYDHAGFRVVVDTAALVQAGPGRWALQVRVTSQGVTREGGVHRVVKGSSATVRCVRAVDRDGFRGTVSTSRDSEHGLCVVVSGWAYVATRLDVDRARRQVTGVVEPTGPDALPPSAVLLRSSRNRAVRCGTRSRPDGSIELTAAVPPERDAADGRGATWDLVVEAGPQEHPVRWPADAPRPIAHDHLLAWAQGQSGQSQVVADTPSLVVTDVDLAGDDLLATVAPAGIGRVELEQARIANERAALRARQVDQNPDGTVRLTFGATTSLFGGPELPAPSGEYTLTAPGQAGADVTARPAPSLLDGLPLDEAHPRTRLSVLRSEQGHLVVELSPPLDDDERGGQRQRALQRAYRERTPAPRASVLFQCYRGEFATDSQLALDEGLRRARPDLERLWGVKDLSTAVPEGAVPLVMGSRSWYDALADSTYLCNNVDFDGFFLKRPHQRYLQTFHGYPFKSMGISFWAGKGYGRDRIALEVARRNREWSSILVPAEFCAEYYRREYAYPGPILATGYPRSDFVVNADRAAVRSRVLDRLGVAGSPTLVLYAPTYRDNLTTRTYAARLFDELDLVALMPALPDDFVLLLRGHNNNQRENDRVLSLPGVVDVTDYPEINDLTVAADVAVLDYSSLRFDWALTGRPMVFFVPDIEEFFGTRPPLFDFRDSAPGPLVRTTAEVAEALSDPDGLAARYAGDIAAFNQRFNGLHDGHATDRVIEAFFQ